MAGARSNLFAWVVNEMVSGKRALPSIHGGALTEAEFAFFVLLHAPINQVLHVQLRDAHSLAGILQQSGVPGLCLGDGGFHRLSGRFRHTGQHGLSQAVHERE